MENKEKEEEDFAEQNGFWSGFFAIVVVWVYGFMTLGFNKLTVIANLVATLLAIIIHWYYNRD